MELTTTDSLGEWSVGGGGINGPMFTSAVTWAIESADQDLPTIDSTPPPTGAQKTLERADPIGA